MILCLEERFLQYSALGYDVLSKTYLPPGNWHDIGP
jgi:hypothetical protein